ncbi:hypothetical protein, partial [Adlercreutzia equolifaciens]|uniref:hypothetical protein n=1 Tax=Adlercreutzia equolifaciens TaxID=446660 RepID=UPI0039F461F3
PFRVYRKWVYVNGGLTAGVFSGAHFSTYTGILILAKIPHSAVCSIEAPVTWGNTPTFIHG